MNYVRKLGFEETPDYDFLRELFTKVIKTLGEPEDGVFDWMLLNNGKGWEASNVSPDSRCHHSPAHAWDVNSIHLLQSPLRHTGLIVGKENESTTAADHDRSRTVQLLTSSFSVLRQPTTRTVAEQPEIAVPPEISTTVSSLSHQQAAGRVSKPEMSARL